MTESGILKKHYKLLLVMKSGFLLLRESRSALPISDWKPLRPQKEETFQVVINIIKNSTCFKTFTISADVLEIFMQQFWYTIKKVQDTNSYEFLLAKKKCIVNAEVFRTILDICPRVEGVDFADVPDDDTALTFLINLGYKGPLNMHTNIENVDYPELIWEDFAYQISHRKEKRSRLENMPYPRFTKIISNHFLKQHKSLTNLNHKHYHTLKVDGIKSRGKGLKGKKTADESQETIDVSEESEPEPKPAKKKTASRRVVKKKVTLSADDNIISDDPDADLELAKSISPIEAEEAEVARKVHATHARIVIESVPESAKKKSSGRSSKSVVIQDTLTTPKSKPATLKAKLKGAPSLTPAEQEAANIMQALKESKKIIRRLPGTGGLNEGTGTIPGVPDEFTVVFATSSEGTGIKLGVLDEEKDITEEKDEKDGDDDDEGDDHVSDTQDADDEYVKTESDEDDIYKYKICMRKDKDEEMKDAKVKGSDKGDEEITDATKEEAEKTSEAKDDTKKTELPLLSSSLSVSSGFGDQFLKRSSDSSLVSTVKDSIDADVSSLLDIPIQHETPQIYSLSIQKIPISVIPETTNLPPIPEIVTETPVTTADPLPQVIPVISTVQQTTTPIPTPTIITDAPTITTAIPESNALTAVELRVAKLEKDMSELKNVDHSSEDLDVLQSYVPTIVDSYLDSKHLPELTKKPTPTAKQESEKSPLEILEIKKEQAESQKNP
ncbi:hypothetical protein Tco_1211144 [Tanacetum coccineum]